MAVIPHDHVGLIIDDAFGFLAADEESYYSRIMVSDHGFLPMTKRGVESRFMGHTSLDPASYVAEIFDCDDFCITAKAVVAADARIQSATNPYAFGFVMTDYHACNFFINEDSQIQMVDFWIGKFSRKNQNLSNFLVDDIGEWMFPGSLRLIYI